MNLASWLIAMVGPLVSRVLVTLGLSMVVTAGVALVATTLKNLILQHLGGMPGASVQLLGLFGVWEAVGMWFGALTFAVTWHTTAGSWRLARIAS